MANTNNHNQTYSNSMLIANNKEFSSVDKGSGEDSVYLYNGKVVATDKVKNDKVIVLSQEDKQKLLKEDGTYDLVNLANILKPITFADTYDTTPTISSNAQNNLTDSKVYDLNNKNDFNTLQKETDMGYINNDLNTKVYFANGMDNTPEQAQASAALISELIKQPVGVIINSTHGIDNDTQEYLKSSLTTKDVLNEYTYRKINDTATTPVTIITHSAGNEDFNKAISLGVNEGYNYPNLQVISVGSPLSASTLNQTVSSANGLFVGQVNNWKDPVTYSKTAATTAIASTAFGVYKGVTTGVAIGVGTGASVGPLETFFYGGLGGAVGGAVGFGSGLYGIQNYHPFGVYLQDPALQTLIKDATK